MLRKLAFAVAAALVLTVAVAGPSAATAPPDSGGDLLAVYTGTVDPAGFAAVVALGVDRHDIAVTGSDAAGTAIEVILSPADAAALASAGTVLEPKVSASARRAAPAGDGVFRPYSGAGGLQEQLAAQAAANPTISELVSIGTTVNGQSIDAVRVTRNASRVRDGSRPATVFVSAQHAREWITPEMTRRLLEYVLAQYGSDPRITRLVNTTELWFVPVANPDGYDFTFGEGNRLWRKNLADNDGDGQVTTGDGVDLNRNFPTRWGYDNEGSSPNPASETYRGPSAASEPETQAMIDLVGRITPQFLVNYHSAAELLLSGIGWQVATPSPDDVIYDAMSGDDADPAVPGYDPDIAAELYTTNGDTDGHVQAAFGTLAFTPEMGTCESASNADPDDQWEAADCGSVFEFPDDESLIEAEFEKNIPFALATAESAKDPNDPVSVVGRDTPDLVAHPFTVSYGDPQTVAVTAKRDLIFPLVRYRVNGGRTQLGIVREWQGGERYGDENDDYYAEYRGTVKGTKPGDSVEVWFSAFPSIRDIRRGGFRTVESDHFTYTVAGDTGNTALVIANEDYTGVNPTYPAGTTGPKYLDEHVAALAANGIASDTWDVDAQGVPDPLGVLSHYDTVLWYLGDNRLTQDPDDEITETYFGDFEDASVAERQQYLTLAVRDWLNEGGQLIYAGETAGYYGALGSSLGGIYYGLDGAPTEDCVVTADPFGDCLLLADDFTQYYLGAYDRAALAPAGVIGTASPLDGYTAPFGGPAVIDNPVDEAGGFTVTSDVLPVGEFPQFASSTLAQYDGGFEALFPVEGEWAVQASHVDDGYQRLARTFDLSDVPAGDKPTFTAQLSYDTELGYDHVIVEARPVGTEAWTTLPDDEGGTTTDVPADCDQGFLLDEHPQLLSYLTPGSPCLPTGTTGEWNSFTGSSDGWVPVSFDLSAYAGQGVQVVVSYVTDPSTGGRGVLLDQTALQVTGAATQEEGFETGLGAWSVLPVPEGSPAKTADWVRTQGPETLPAAAVGTSATVMLGFGLEQLATDDDRAALVGRILAYLAG